MDDENYEYSFDEEDDDFYWYPYCYDDEDDWEDE